MIRSTLLKSPRSTYDQLMEEKRWLTLPVTQHGWEADSVT
jgi:hypothetical protein